MNATHETFQPANDVSMGSDRTFGVVFASVFALLGLLPLIDGDAPRMWALAVAIGLVALALLVPRLLRPFNIVWFRFGVVLHRLVSLVVLCVLFFVMVTPTALVMRAFDKDPLRLRRDPDAASYWIERTPPGPPPETMKNQF